MCDNRETNVVLALGDIVLSVILMGPPPPMDTRPRNSAVMILEIGWAGSKIWNNGRGKYVLISGLVGM